MGSLTRLAFDVAPRARRRAMLWSMKTFLLFGSLSLLACGGVVIDDASGGSGGSGSGAGGPTSSTGISGCQSHTDCGDNQLCLFQTGVCTQACGFESCDSCGPGFVCEDCATSACPDCLDCRAACLPQSGDLCDDDDPCQPGFVCLFEQGRCAPECENGKCADPNLICSSCASSSCCGCENCADACVVP